jgi:hypothetical protein
MQLPDRASLPVVLFADRHPAQPQVKQEQEISMHLAVLPSPKSPQARFNM